jgi:hypothetical protein
MIESNDEESYNCDRDWWRLILYIVKKITMMGNDFVIIE